MLTSKQMRWAQKNLVEKRGRDVKQLSFGKAVLTLVQRQLAEAEAEQGAPPPPAPEVEPLRSAHLAVGKALRSAIQTFGMPEISSPEQVAAAERLREAFFGGPMGSNTGARNRATEVVHLAAHRESVDPDVALFEGTPIPGLVAEWFATGLVLGEALEQAAEPAEVLSSSRRAQLNEGRRLFSALRDGIRAELFFRPELPQDLEARIMGFHDSMLDSRGRREQAEDEPEMPAAQPTILAVVGEG